MEIIRLLDLIAARVGTGSTKPFSRCDFALRSAGLSIRTGGFQPQVCLGKHCLREPGLVIELSRQQAVQSSSQIHPNPHNLDQWSLALDILLNLL